MALFPIQRYMGEDSPPTNNDQAEKILKKIEKEAAKRRSKQRSAIDENKKQKKLKRKTNDDFQDNFVTGETTIENQTSVGKQRKRKNHKINKKNNLLEDVVQQQIPSNDITLISDDEVRQAPMKESNISSIRSKSKLKQGKRKLHEKTKDEFELPLKKKKKVKSVIKEGKILDNVTDTGNDTVNYSTETTNEINRIKSGLLKNKKKKKPTVFDKVDEGQMVHVDGSTENDTKINAMKHERNTKLDSKKVKQIASDGDGSISDDTLDETLDAVKEDTGFTVIGSYLSKKTQQVDRVLPQWLSSPSVISANIREDKADLEEVKGLHVSLIDRLKENGITHFFPVQKQLIPALLEGTECSTLIGRAGYRPSDICCSAPTGSGKTLAFVIPIVQALMSRTVCCIRALAVLPVRDLALQVYKVFRTYCQGTKLKVGLIIGQKAFAVEQAGLVKKCFSGVTSKVDIVIATPGRLVDHINKTEGFSLKQLRFLVIDEADRMMDEIKQDWLIQVERAAYSMGADITKCDDVITRCDDVTYSRDRIMPTSISIAHHRLLVPLQKLLFSATLSQNPEKLEQLNLFKPKLFTSVVHGSDENSSSATKTGEFEGKYTTPVGLTEYYSVVSKSEKPLALLYFVHHMQFKNILCFTNSTESTHRLYLLMKLYGGIVVKELSSKLHGTQRTKILKKFQAGKIDMLICSDAMARGMDVSNARYVISYEFPPYLKTYIHRVGRTARGGNAGTALSLLEKKEVFHFKKMLRNAGKSGFKKMKLEQSSFKPLIPDYEECLKELAGILQNENKSK